MKKPALERHLFVSDFQIPEYDEAAIQAVLSFVPDFQPDFIHFVGDILDLTSLSKYDKDVYDRHTFMDEITIGRAILKRFADIARKSQRSVKLRFYFGNHEQRSLNYLARKAPELADLESEDEYILSLPHLLEFKKLGIDHVPYYKEYFIHNRYIVEHGDIARQHSGYTAKAMLERRGYSGFSGHTHRLALHMVTQSGITKFWVETGGFFRMKFKHPYTRSGNWQQGFSVAFYDPTDDAMHPVVIPIYKGKFVYAGKTYRGN